MPPPLHTTITPTNLAEYDHLLTPYRNLTDAQLRRADLMGHAGLFIAESELVVRALIQSTFQIGSILLTPQRLQSFGPDLHTLLNTHPRQTPPPILVAVPTLIESITGFDFHRGVLATGLRPTQLPTLSAFLQHHKPDSLLILADLTNIDNIGAAFRNLAALGSTNPAVILTETCPDPLYRKSLRVSVGHALTIPFTRVSDLHTALSEVDAAGFSTLALVTDRDALPIQASAHTRPAIVVGSEGEGLPTITKAHVRNLSRGKLVTIPMRPGIDSLNAATALAVALSHLNTTEPFRPSCV
jgi:tRNA G18 (ribose-2'-O)-methylase SpoU